MFQISRELYQFHTFIIKKLNFLFINCLSCSRRSLKFIIFLPHFQSCSLKDICRPQKFMFIQSPWYIQRSFSPLCILVSILKSALPYSFHIALFNAAEPCCNAVLEYYSNNFIKQEFKLTKTYWDRLRDRLHSVYLEWREPRQKCVLSGCLPSMTNDLCLFGWSWDSVLGQDQRQPERLQFCEFQLCLQHCSSRKNNSRLSTGSIKHRMAKTCLGKIPLYFPPGQSINHFSWQTGHA